MNTRTTLSYSNSKNSFKDLEDSGTKLKSDSGKSLKYSSISLNKSPKVLSIDQSLSSLDRLRSSLCKIDTIDLCETKPVCESYRGNNRKNTLTSFNFDLNFNSKYIKSSESKPVQNKKLETKTKNAQTPYPAQKLKREIDYLT